MHLVDKPTEYSVDLLLDDNSIPATEGLCCPILSALAPKMAFLSLHNKVALAQGQFQVSLTSVKPRARYTGSEKANNDLVNGLP